MSAHFLRKQNGTIQKGTGPAKVFKFIKIIFHYTMLVKHLLK